MKLILKILAGLFVAVILVAIAGNFYLRSKLPQYEGERQLSGLNAPVKIYFDEFAVPHIYAENEEDAYHALGYVHAQERIFQMDLMRRAGKGELSALLGEATVKTDKLFRTLGVGVSAKKLAAKQLSDKNAPYTKACTAYIQGVNDYIATGKGSVEYLLLGQEIEEFTTEDIYAIGGIVAFGFAQGFKTEPIVDQIRALDAKYISQLPLGTQEGRLLIQPFRSSGLGDSASITRQPAHQGVNVTSDLAAISSSEAMAILSEGLHEALDGLPIPLWAGSNGWAIAGTRTQSGKPLFASDTHMGYSQPGVWFEAHLSYPGQEFWGLHAGGIPFGLIGYNQQVAWGLTMFQNDGTDFSREKINPNNPAEVWSKGAWVPLTLRKEVIEVKGQEPVTFQVRETPRGPILSDLEHLPWSKLGEQPISVWWEFTELEITSLMGWYEFAHAKNMDDMREGASLLNAPGLNVMTADREGNIAWWAAGQLYQRAEGSNHLFIREAEDTTNLPGKPLDFYHNPRAENPTWGYIYSANHKPASALGIDMPGYHHPDDRGRVIDNALKVRNDWDLKGVEALQFEDRSSEKEEITGKLLSFLDKPSYAGTKLDAYEALENWNGSHEPNDTAPAIYYRFLYSVFQNMMGDELGKEGVIAFLKSPLALHVPNPILGQPNNIWWDNQGTEAKETAQDIVRASFDEAVSFLEKRLQSDKVSDWSWGQWHTIKHPHALGSVALLDKLFSIGKTPITGGRETVNNTTFHLDEEGEKLFMTHLGPAMRLAIDFSDPEHVRNILPTGQSGHVLSPHYRDQAALYNTNGRRTQTLNRQEVEANAMGVLILQ